ncbi:hypothetical protein [Teredinibacter waterburyi]|uniref:hypothetical protein n=1 Tax=Teredinibacter waterburyi TaxID=1500538 RepID=UPI00165F80C8|nr:hypothetical protein [Teredinibacter waterburyi]
MLNSVMNEGVRGMQNAQREMHRSASEIAQANTSENRVGQQPVSETVDRVAATDSQPLKAVEASVQSDSGGSIVEPLIELRRQEQVFDASAQLVSIADKTLGSLIDVKS